MSLSAIQTHHSAPRLQRREGVHGRETSGGQRCVMETTFQSAVLSHAGHANAEPEPAPPAREEASAPPSSGESATATATRPAPPRVDQLPPWKVLLHNDDVNDMPFVVNTIVELTPLNKERAVQATLEAHVSGLTLLLVTHKERAELYRDQFQSKSLTVTIEPHA